MNQHLDVELGLDAKHLVVELVLVVNLAKHLEVELLLDAKHPAA